MPQFKSLIRTPDQRLRVFVSSTLQELGDERQAARQAIERLHLSPVMFELGARPHPPQELYRAYLDQSHIFVGIYWQKYGWVAPDMTISGLEDEYNLSGDKPKLIYIKSSAPDREPRLKDLINRIKTDNVSYKYFATADELRESVENDLMMMLTESFESAQPVEAIPAETRLPRHNLPAPLTRLVGRETELAMLHDVLTHSHVSLLTLTGPGGTGKSRLALQIALDARDHFDDGVFLVNLASIHDPELLAPAIATALDVRETPGHQSLPDNLKNHLRDKRILLWLDNFEQVIDGAPIVADLMGSCPQLKILVTSRMSLHLRGEREFPVAPLALPDRQQRIEVEQLSQCAAVVLFVQRACDVKPTFAITAENAAVIAEICLRLDGLPLAIELAAARIRVLSPQALLARLERSLDILTGGARDLPVRQQTLHNTIEWSYALLDPAVQALFRRLAVFHGGWSLEAAETACGADGPVEYSVFDGLTVLIDSSLIKRIESLDGEPRFGMLQTIRTFARQPLIESGEEAKMQRRHAEYFLAWAEAAEPKLHSSEQMHWLDCLELEHDNLHAAQDWFVTQLDGVEASLRLAAALAWFWFVRGHWSEGRQWLDTALARRSDAVSARSRAHALNAAGLLACYQGDSVRARAYLNESIALCQQSGDQVNLAYALTTLSIETQWRDDMAEARRLVAQSVTWFREAGDQWGLAYALYLEGMCAFWQSDYPTTRALYEESIGLFSAVGDRWRLSGPLGRLGDLAYRDGDYAQAQKRYTESLTLFRELNDKLGIASALNPLGDLARAQGEFRQALAYHQEALALYQELGDKQGITWACHSVGAAARQLHDFAQAEAFLQRSLGLMPEIGDSGGIPWVMQSLGFVKAARGNYHGALTLFQMALSMAHQLNHVVTFAFCFPGLASAAAGLGQMERAARLLGKAETLRERVAEVGSSADAVEYDQALAEARAHVDQAAYAAAVAEGRAMSLDDAIAYATEEQA